MLENINQRTWHWTTDPWTGLLTWRTGLLTWRTGLLIRLNSKDPLIWAAALLLLSAELSIYSIDWLLPLLPWQTAHWFLYISPAPNVTTSFSSLQLRCDMTSTYTWVNVLSYIPSLFNVIIGIKRLRRMSFSFLVSGSWIHLANSILLGQTFKMCYFCSDAACNIPRYIYIKLH